MSLHDAAAALDTDDLRRLRRALDGDDDDANGGGDGTAPAPAAARGLPPAGDALDGINQRLRRLGFPALSGAAATDGVPALLLEILPEYERRGTLVGRLVQKLGDLHNKYDVLERLWREQTQHQRTADAEELAQARALLAESRERQHQLAVERDAAVRAREQAERERDIAAGERDKALHERDVAAGERDRALHERSVAAVERDKALHERDKALHERDERDAAQRDVASRERSQAPRQSPDAASASDRHQQYRAVVKTVRQMLQVASSSRVVEAVEHLQRERNEFASALQQVHNVTNAMALMLALPPLGSTGGVPADPSTALIRVSTAVTRLKEERDSLMFSLPGPAPGSGATAAPAPAPAPTAAHFSLDTPFRELVQHFRRLFEVHSTSPELLVAAMNELYIERTELLAAANVARRVLNLDPTSPVLHVIERLEKLRR